MQSLGKLSLRVRSPCFSTTSYSDFLSFSHIYYTFDIIDLITKLSKKLEVGETAKLLQKLSFRTKYLSYVQTKKNPPLPHLWEVRNKR